MGETMFGRKKLPRTLSDLLKDQRLSGREINPLVGDDVITAARAMKNAVRSELDERRSVDIREALDKDPAASIPNTPISRPEDIVGDITSATAVVEDSITNIFKGEELDKMEAAEKRSEKYLSAFDKGLETHKETAATLEREIMAKVSELLDLRKVIVAHESALVVLNAKPTPVPTGDAAGVAMKVLNNAVKPKVRTATRKRKPEPVELAA